MNYSYNIGTDNPATIISSLILAALAILAMWKIFQKAGKPGWAAIIPFYNIYTMYEITWGKGWKFLMLLIPIYGWIVLPILTAIKLGKAFKKSTGFIVGLVLLNIVFELILAFNKDTYAGVPESDK